MTHIVQKEDPVLRKIAKEVHVKEIQTPKIKAVLTDMKKALASQDDGVAIAAPQIGESYRIFTISHKVLMDIDKAYKKGAPEIFINPEIIKRSKKQTWMEEGCLSVRYLYGKIKRADKVTIRAYNEKGFQFQREAEGLLAQIFQHETDHLNGILFIDKAKNLEEIPPEKHAK